MLISVSELMRQHTKDPHFLRFDLKSPKSFPGEPGLGSCPTFGSSPSLFFEMIGKKGDLLTFKREKIQFRGQMGG
jgi:hypothetical protein